MHLVERNFRAAHAVNRFHLSQELVGIDAGALHRGAQQPDIAVQRRFGLRHQLGFIAAQRRDPLGLRIQRL